MNYLYKCIFFIEVLMKIVHTCIFFILFNICLICPKIEADIQIFETSIDTRLNNYNLNTNDQKKTNKPMLAKENKNKTQKGDRGEKGEIGPKGEKGDSGPRGEKGECGPRGEQGPKGDQGEKGEAGSRGPKGTSFAPIFGSFYTLSSPSEIILSNGDLVPFNIQSSVENVFPINGGFQTKVAGKFRITFGIQGLSSTNGNSQFILRKNGNAVPGGTLEYKSNLATSVMQSLSVIIDSIAFQTIDIQYLCPENTSTIFKLYTETTGCSIAYFCIEKLK